MPTNQNYHRVLAAAARCREQLHAIREVLEEEHGMPPYEPPEDEPRFPRERRPDETDGVADYATSELKRLRTRVAELEAEQGGAPQTETECEPR